ncbi:MAG: F0F1 ATP synthase subunit B [Alphaproteobacteria bacterium]
MTVNEEFWVAVAFVVFVAALFRPVGRMITAMLDKRAARIKEELDEAVRLREEAQALLASYQRKQRGALKEAEEILARAREEAERQATRAREELEAELTRRRAQAMDRIARAEAEAVQEVRELAADLALKATRRLIAEKMDAKREAELIDEAIAEIGKKLH